MASINQRTRSIIQFNSIHQLFIPRKYKKNVVVINTIGQSNMQISHQYHKAMNIR